MGGARPQSRSVSLLVVLVGRLVQTLRVIHLLHSLKRVITRHSTALLTSINNIISYTNSLKPGLKFQSRPFTLDCINFGSIKKKLK